MEENKNPPQSKDSLSQSKDSLSQSKDSLSQSKDQLSQSKDLLSQPETSRIQPQNYSPRTDQQFKRNIAYKLRVGQILAGKPILEQDKLKHVELNNKHIVRVNIIANVTDKYIQDGERKFASITLDDASGQIKVKTFGEDITKLTPLNQGDTLMIIGMLRYWNNEIYLTPEIIKKKSPQFLLIRKLESDLEAPKQIDSQKLTQLKDLILTMIKDAEKVQGIDIDKIIMDLHEPTEIINSEIKKLLEDGLIYEPRPGKLRYLG